MPEDLKDEINAAVHARLRVRDISKALWEAAVREVGEVPMPDGETADARKEEP